MLPGHRTLESIRWAQLRQVFDSMPISIALRDRDHRFLYANLEYTKIHDQPENAMLGRTIAEVLGEVLDKENYARLYSQCERALAGEIVEWDGWEERRSGQRYVRRTVARCVTLRARLRDTSSSFVI